LWLYSLSGRIGDHGIMTGDEPGSVLEVLFFGVLVFAAAMLFLGVYGMWWVGP